MVEIFMRIILMLYRRRYAYDMDLTGGITQGGDIIADNFNVTAGNDFIHYYNISAYNFNVTA